MPAGCMDSFLDSRGTIGVRAWVTPLCGSYDPGRRRLERSGCWTQPGSALPNSEEKVRQLETALESRVIVEQAKGALGERLAIGVDEAFELLRYAARSHRVKLHELAARVIREDVTPAPVIVAIARSQRARAAWMRELAEAHVVRVRELRTALDEQVQRLREHRQRKP